MSKLFSVVLMSKVVNEGIMRNVLYTIKAMAIPTDKIKTFLKKWFLKILFFPISAPPTVYRTGFLPQSELLTPPSYMGCRTTHRDDWSLLIKLWLPIIWNTIQGHWFWLDWIDLTFENILIPTKVLFFLTHNPPFSYIHLILLRILIGTRENYGSSKSTSFLVFMSIAKWNLLPQARKITDRVNDKG